MIRERERERAFYSTQRQRQTQIIIYQPIETSRLAKPSARDLTALFVGRRVGDISGRRHEPVARLSSPTVTVNCCCLLSGSTFEKSRPKVPSRPLIPTPFQLSKSLLSSDWARQTALWTGRDVIVGAWSSGYVIGSSKMSRPTRCRSSIKLGDRQTETDEAVEWSGSD